MSEQFDDTGVLLGFRSDESTSEEPPAGEQQQEEEKRRAKEKRRAEERLVELGLDEPRQADPPRVTEEEELEPYGDETQPLLPYKKEQGVRRHRK